MTDLFTPSAPAREEHLHDPFVEAQRLGPVPLAAGETQQAYDHFAKGLYAALAPRDMVELLTAREIVDLAWEHRRWGLYKRLLVENDLHDGLATLLRERGVQNTQELVQQWAAREMKVAAKVNDLLSRFGLSMEHVASKTMLRLLCEIETLDAMMARNELRRLALMRQMERHRAIINDTGPTPLIASVVSDVVSAAPESSA
jgi:hypothetical protein